MTRRRLLSIAALMMVLAALFSTETAEALCRAVIGASMDADDNGLYFTCPQQADTNHSTLPASRARASTVSKRAVISQASQGDSVVDEPTFNLPQIAAAIAPDYFPRIHITTQAVAYAIDVRGPPVHSVRFARPPPRGPPSF